MRGLTELDYCVLGVIWRSGPLSAYGVRREFRESTTTSWSSSSGSIYPSIRRLLAAGHAVASERQDGRGAQSLTITSQGLAELRSWVLDLRPELGTATPDPIRTRAQFLTSISCDEQARFVAKAQRITREAVRALERIADANRGDPAQALDQLGTLGSILELKARHQWLGSVLDLLSEELSPHVGAMNASTPD